MKLYLTEDDKIRVLLFDDSRVRGNTSKKTISIIAKHAGIDEVHFRVGSPPVVFPCYYGVDIPTLNELSDHGRTIEEIRCDINDYCGSEIVKSLEYLTVEEMLDAVIMAGGIMGKKYRREDFCAACFTGEYPEEGGRARFLQEYGKR
jgi:amidophosphoribosyltransferase